MANSPMDMVSADDTGALQSGLLISFTTRARMAYDRGLIQYIQIHLSSSIGQAVIAVAG